MPKQIEFIESKNYMSGFNIFSDKRTLNIIEVGFIIESIEVNIFIIQLCGLCSNGTKNRNTGLKIYHLSFI